MNLAKYADLFRTESREHLAEIDAALLALEQGGDAQHVTVLFRSTHTIKGMAASMGYEHVERLSHALETLLDGVRSGARVLDADVVALLFDGADALASAVDAAVEGNGNDVSGAFDAMLQRLASAADTRTATSSGGVAGDSERNELAHDVFPVARVAEARSERNATQADARSDGRAETRVVEIRIAPDAALKGVRAMMAVAKLEALGTVRAIDPAQHQWNLDAFDGTLTVTLDTAAALEEIERAVRSAGDIARVTLRQPTVTRSERETLRHVRIDARRLDALLDLVGELVITRDRLVRTAERQHAPSDVAAERALATAVHDTSRLVSALQDEVLRTRMTPVGQVFDRFPRLVRDVARDLGKEVTFVTEGRDIELDRSLLDAIGDPIVHLLRNAIDHGLERPDVRRNVGKPPAGRLVLRAARDRATIIVQVSDDGRGIDRDAVLARAQASGIVDSDTTSLSDDGLLRVLARAGFSTAATITSVSGRGVGIDVVASRVRSLGGSLDVQSAVGQGTTFTLRLPVTLAIVRALLVRVADETYALPASHVLEALEFDARALGSHRDRETVTLRDEVIPLLRLHGRFGLGRTRQAETHLVIVESGAQRLALEVDSLVGQQDVVVKAYDTVLGAESLFSGATILGDGTPALIVDLGSLA